MVNCFTFCVKNKSCVFNFKTENHVVKLLCFYMVFFCVKMLVFLVFKLCFKDRKNDKNQCM